jgi:hypothetical protein
MKRKILIAASVLLWAYPVISQEGFSSLTTLNPISVSTNTGEKPQAKVWEFAGKHWAVLPNSSGTHLWRLDGTSWTNVRRLSTRTSTKADCKVVGDVAHILLFQGASSQLVSVEYSPAQGTFQLWSHRTSTVELNLQTSTETATIDIDGNGRMWLAYDGKNHVYVRWSDPPYSTWSSPISLASDISSDDICAVVAMPGKIGVFWSNQNSKRFGFKTHNDGANPTSWSGDEVPASQSSLNVGNGMADDHMNLAVGSDGTLYSAVKTGYDSSSHPDIALLVRRPSGTWDNLYEVSRKGTRPIVVFNEAMNKIRVAYTDGTSGGDILYKESSGSTISFGPEFKLITGNYNNPTSTKANFSSEVVILASSNTQAVGVLAKDIISSTLEAPLLVSPVNAATDVSTGPLLSWNSSQGANIYEVQVSPSGDFSDLFFHQQELTGTSITVSGLAENEVYFWRVRAKNSQSTSAWSLVWSFTTGPAISGGELVANWKMDEGSGTSLIDASDYANHASISGSPSWIIGVSEKALRFNGSQYAAIGDNNSLDLTDKLTIATWIKPEKRATQYLIKKADHNVTDGFELSLASGGSIFFRFNQNSSGNTYRLDSQVNYPSDGNTWMHVAVTYDRSYIRLYINGVENNVLSVASGPLIANNNLNLTVGAGNAGYRGLQGAMDEIYLYNSVLNASQIYGLAHLTSVVGIPNQISPANGNTEISLTPTLNWSGDGDSYGVQVATDAEFLNQVVDMTGVADEFLNISGLSYGVTYYWRVRAMAGGNMSDWSAVWSFTTLSAPVNIPTLLSPADAATEVSLTPTLTWSGDTETYDVQVATDVGFTTPVVDQTGISAEFLKVSSLSHGLTYYWRARGVNGTSVGQWSSVWSFTTIDAELIAPLLISPGNQAVDIATSTTLSWQASNGAETYAVQVSGLADFSSLVLDQSQLTQTSATITSLSEGTTYYWRVRAINSSGESNWSLVWSFTTVPAAVSIPTLLSPADAATEVSLTPTLTWSGDTETYNVQVATDVGFTSRVVDQTGITAEFLEVSGLSNGLTYYWRARGVNGTSAGEWSSVWRFTTISSSSPGGDLVANWKMDEGSGTSLIDASDYANHATIFGGPSWINGVLGQALRFNGSQYAGIADNPSLDLAGQLTIATWIKPEKRGTQYLIKKADHNGTDGYELSLANGGTVFFRFNQNGSGNTYRLDSQVNYPTNGSTWMHVAVTYDRSYIRLYINGVENNVLSVSGPVINNNNLSLTIGAGNAGFRGLQGAMDEIYLYKSVLTASEIQSLFDVSSTQMKISSQEGKTNDIFFEILGVEQADVDPSEDLLPEEEISVYPNPFVTSATLRLSFPENVFYTATLYDGKGTNIVKIANGQAIEGEVYEYPIEGEALARGVYLVQIKTSKGTVKTIRLLLKDN